MTDLKKETEDASDQDHLTDELMKILKEINPDVLRTILKTGDAMEKAKRTAKPSHGPVKHYTKFIKRYICTTCSSNFVVEDVLEDNESTSYVRTDGSCGVATGSKNKEKIVVTCLTSHCSFCAREIRMWDRGMLEDRFIRLTSNLVGTKFLW